MIALVHIGYGLLAVYEYIPLLKQKIWKDFKVNLVLGIISLVTAVLLCFGVKIPSPEAPIREVITSIFGK
jgi:uncharacterized membrane protein